MVREPSPFGQPSCSAVAQMFYNVLLYTNSYVRYVTKIVFKMSGIPL